MMWKNFLSILSRNNVHHNLSTNVPKRTLWGVAPTGNIHIGYLPYVGILTQLKKFGTEVICLNANYHSYLDSIKTEWDAITDRTKYYNLFFEAFDLDTNVIESKKVYIKKSYIEGFFRFSNNLPSEKLKLWGRRTLRRSINKDYTLGDFIYVGTQIFDVIYFDLDLLLCGEDESDIYRYSLPLLQDLSKKKYFHIYVPMIPGIYKDEMHASDDDSNKIVVHDNIETIKEKIEIYIRQCLKIKKKPLLIFMIENLILPLFDINPNRDILNVLERKRDINIKYVAEKVAMDIDKILNPVRKKYLEVSV